MIRNIVGSAILGALLVAAPVVAQDFQRQTLAPEQLDDLVAPIALYPDSLLSQVLVASTYPLELVEANQWLAQYANLQGQERIDGAQQQNWDASVQALVAFPEVVTRMTQDVRWTTDLGNAFLAQEGDLMSAVQRMRQRAQQSGKLTSTPQQVVNTDNQGGEPVIEIQPADPQVVYVPAYNPAYIWGPPAYGYYPSLYYPSVGYGFGFSSGVAIGAFFGGWGGGWGWGPRWHEHAVYVNDNFFHRYRFDDRHEGRFGGGRAVRSHDRVEQGNFGRNNFAQPHQSSPRGFSGNFGRSSAPAQAAPAQQQRFGTPQFEQRNSGGERSAFGPVRDGGRARMEGDHAFSSMGRGAQPQRSAPAAHAPPSHEGGGGRGRGWR